MNELNRQFLNILLNLKSKTKIDYNIKHLSWMKLDATAEILVTAFNEDELQQLLRNNHLHAQLHVNIIGAGSNVIFCKNVKGLLIKLGNAFTEIKYVNDLIEVGAACLNHNLANYALNENIKNLEFLSTIPGNVGGGIAMNAGAYGSEYKDVIYKAKGIDKQGNFHEFNQKQLSSALSYRHNALAENLIFIKIYLKAEKSNAEDILAKMNDFKLKRKLTQPIAEKTSGSTFANPTHDIAGNAVSMKAWELIDQIGYRGKKVGGVKMSEQHCNFMINDGTASADDAIDLIKAIRLEVKEKFNIDLRPEVKIIK